MKGERTLNRGGRQRKSFNRNDNPITVAMLQCWTVGVNVTLPKAHRKPIEFMSNEKESMSCCCHVWVSTLLQQIVQRDTTTLIIQADWNFSTVMCVMCTQRLNAELVLWSAHCYFRVFFILQNLQKICSSCYKFFRQWWQQWTNQSTCAYNQGFLGRFSPTLEKATHEKSLNNKNQGTELFLWCFSLLHRMLLLLLFSNQFPTKLWDDVHILEIAHLVGLVWAFLLCFSLSLLCRMLLPPFSD